MPMSRAVMLAVPPRSTASNGKRANGLAPKTVSRTACTVPSPPLIATMSTPRSAISRNASATEGGSCTSRQGMSGMGGEHAAHRRGGAQVRAASRIAQDAERESREARRGIGRRACLPAAWRRGRHALRAVGAAVGEDAHRQVLLVHRLADFGEPRPDRFAVAIWPGRRGAAETAAAPSTTRSTRQPPASPSPAGRARGSR